MCLSSTLFFLTFVKAAAIVLFCRPLVVVPIMVRAGVIAAVVLLALPAYPEICPSTPVLYREVIREFTLGIWIGVVISAVFYGMELFSHWLVSLMLPPRQFVHRQSSRLLIGGIYLALLAITIDIVSTPLSEAIGKVVSPSSGLSASLLMAVSESADSAWRVALLLAAPYIIAVVALDISLFVGNRFLRGTVTRSLHHGLRLPLVIMLLSVLLLPHSDVIAVHLGRLLPGISSMTVR